MSGRFLLTGVMLALSGCAEPELSPEALLALEGRAQALAGSLRAETRPEPGGVVVRLLFDDNVDLDLYVTDPLLETVYFARHESRTGGFIDADMRCDTIADGKAGGKAGGTVGGKAAGTGPRVEEIRFPDPWPGRYRVGVDFPARCDGSATRAPAPYAVLVSANGKLHEAHGLVNLEFFEVVVLEFEVFGSQPDHGDS